MAFTNILLSKLSAADLALIKPTSSVVELKLNDILDVATQPIQYGYFVQSGMLSMISEYDHGREIEVGVIGREGFSNVGLVLDDDLSVNRTVVQFAGSAIRVPVRDLLRAIALSSTLQAVLLRYTRSLDIQMASTASSTGRAKLEERLARWLLMAQDRLDTNVFDVTHHFLSQLLCCRRPGVTVSLHLLETRGVIRPSRGQITIIDRAGLEMEANGAYGQAEEEYVRLIGEDYRAYGTGRIADEAPS